MVLAHRAGLRVFATGGIGGVHPAGPSGQAFDVSADLLELARTPMAVVCAGAKSILDLAATLEVLETLGGAGRRHRHRRLSRVLPALQRPSRSPCRVETPDEAAALVTTHWQLGGAGVVLALPLPAETALIPRSCKPPCVSPKRQPRRQGVHGPALTPFLLARLAEETTGRRCGRTRRLIVANAALCRSCGLFALPEALTCAPWPSATSTAA